MKIRVRQFALFVFAGLVFTLIIKCVSAAGYEYPVGGTVEFADKLVLVAPIVSIGVVAIVILGVIARVLINKSEDT